MCPNYYSNRQSEIYEVNHTKEKPQSNHMCPPPPYKLMINSFKLMRYNEHVRSSHMTREQHFKLTVVRPQSLTHPLTVTSPHSPDRSDRQPHDLEARHIRLTYHTHTHTSDEPKHPPTHTHTHTSHTHIFIRGFWSHD